LKNISKVSNFTYKLKSVENNSTIISSARKNNNFVIHEFANHFSKPDNQIGGLFKDDVKQMASIMAIEKKLINSLERVSDQVSTSREGDENYASKSTHTNCML
jgi:hypothetical protein